MNQNFKLKYDSIKENDPGRSGDNNLSANETMYHGHSHARVICFSWPDNRRLFLNYAYLISGEYLPLESTITLIFTSHTVLIKGRNLDILFEQLMLQSIRLIVSTEERYAELEDELCSVYDIQVESQN